MLSFTRPPHGHNNPVAASITSAQIIDIPHNGKVDVVAEQVLPTIKSLRLNVEAQFWEERDYDPYRLHKCIYLADRYIGYSGTPYNDHRLFTSLKEAKLHAMEKCGIDPLTAESESEESLVKRFDRSIRIVDY